MVEHRERTGSRLGRFAFFVVVAGCALCAQSTTDFSFCCALKKLYVSRLAALYTVRKQLASSHCFVFACFLHHTINTHTMNIGILGTGMVGATVASKLIECGHTVTMGSRTADNPKAIEWATKHTEQAGQARHGTFADAAAVGEILFLCTAGSATLEVLRLAKHDNFRNKIIVDIANPLNFSQKSGPSLYISGGMDSLGEQVQRTIPSAKVVKTLNTVTADIMVAPHKIGNDHDMFIAGNDDDAKAAVVKLLKEFGWSSIHDLGDITGARAMESHLLLWIRLWGRLGTGNFNIKIVK
jgi:8-hydroxy-5-deazaflavin:NADPH oxidoreductase